MFATFALFALLHQPLLVQDDEPVAPPPMGRNGLALHCSSRAEFIQRLKAAGGEPLFVGLIDQGMAIEVWHNTQPGDLWLAFLTRPDGTACLFSHGIGFGFTPPKVTEPKSSEDDDH